VAYGVNSLLFSFYQRFEINSYVLKEEIYARGCHSSGSSRRNVRTFWRELKNPYNRIGWLTYNIGEVYRDQGRLQEAFEQFEEALQIFSRMQYVYGMAHVKIELGRVGVRIGSLPVAMQNIQEAIDIFRRINGKSGEAYALAALGEMYIYQGQLDLALQYVQEGFLIETMLGNLKEVGRSLWLMGLIYEQQGKSSLLAGRYTAEACAYFYNAIEKIAQAQQLFTQIDTAPNIYGIQDLSTRVQKACTQCQKLSLLQS
jgi:tetratricopeptide (TPR) repeat protein